MFPRIWPHVRSEWRAHYHLLILLRGFCGGRCSLTTFKYSMRVFGPTFMIICLVASSLFVPCWMFASISMPSGFSVLQQLFVIQRTCRFPISVKQKTSNKACGTLGIVWRTNPNRLQGHPGSVGRHQWGNLGCHFGAHWILKGIPKSCFECKSTHSATNEV